VLLAVVDLGSNSFKMTVAQWVPGPSRSRPFRILHKERHPVQLGATVFQTGRIVGKERKDAYRALERMQVRLRDFSAPILRVVATSAIREAADGKIFVEDVRRRLGLPIEIITGTEEASLIARGLEWEYPQVSKGLLVDIGGGSTEVATFGKGWPKSFVHSFRLGSVRVATMWFKQRKTVSLAKIRGLIRPTLRFPRPTGVEKLLGSAGTIQSLGDILGRGSKERVIRRAELDRWIEANLRKSPDALGKEYGLTPSRARVVVPGSIILSEVLHWLGRDEIIVTQMTLRDGLLVDLVTRWKKDEKEIRKSALSPTRGRVDRGASAALLKELEVRAQRFGVDHLYHHHAATLALSLFDQLSRQGLAFRPEERLYLLVAAYLHGIGRLVSEDGYHKHSAYMIRHLELPGLDEEDMQKAALVALYHRKGPPPKKDPMPWGVKGVHAHQVRRMAALLRFIVGLDRGQKRQIPSLEVKIARRQALVELHRSSSDAMDMMHFRAGASYFEELFALKVVPYVSSRRQ
jgi:exopolyphosphatase/guanosine-5'-triphosphate,3'-diphosphate pyrophosphatase